MLCQWIFGHRVVVALQAYGFGVAYVVDGLYAGLGLADAEAASGEHLFVAACVQVGEALAELERVAVDGDAAVAAAVPFWQVAALVPMLI